MEKLTTEGLFNLSHGDKVYKWDGNHFKKLYFVARMPKSERYLIFCDGEYLTHLYINKEGSFSNSWYKGEYDGEFVGNLKLEKLESEIESVKKIYLNK